MIFIRHRVNSLAKLKNVPSNEGVEIDLRSKNNDIYLHHDPFKKGELFSNWIKSFKHRLIVLNVKEEGLEPKILSILKRNNVKNYFFHDQTFSTLIKNMHKTKVSVRYSEFEGLKNIDKLFNSIKWIWIDNFTEIKINKEFYSYLKKKKVKICIVSPELVKKSRSKEIKKVISYLKKNKFKIDAVCTKNSNLWIDQN